MKKCRLNMYCHFKGLNIPQCDGRSNFHIDNDCRYGNLISHSHCEMPQVIEMAIHAEFAFFILTIIADIQNSIQLDYIYRQRLQDMTDKTDRTGQDRTDRTDRTGKDRTDRTERTDMTDRTHRTDNQFYILTTVADIYNYLSDGLSVCLSVCLLSFWIASSRVNTSRGTIT